MYIEKFIAIAKRCNSGTDGVDATLVRQQQGIK